MSQLRTIRPTRRSLLAAGGAAGLGALLTACGGGSGGGGGGSSDGGGGGSWSFTDDRHKKVTLDGPPQRIVAFTGTAAALHDFGITDQVVGVFGPTKLKNGDPDPQAGDLDVDELTVIGNTYGEFDVEKYATTRPDVLITNMYDPGALWYVPQEAQKKILKLAPAIALTSARRSLLKIVERYADLANALGADLSSHRVTGHKKSFEQAAADLRAAAKANRGLKVMAASGSRDLFYVSNPEINADLMYFRELGVDIVVPDNPDKGGYFESLSWENADKYDADLILLDSRTSALQPDALADKPAWRALPAVQAGQVIPWASEPRFSYAGCAPLISDIAKSVQGAKKVA
jgi:iron complex transport system substrate-binding protein